MTVRTLTVWTAVLALAGLAAAHAQPARGPATAAQTASAAAGDPERGRYLVERVAMCVECHSGRDAALTIVPRERYMGGAIPFLPPAGWAERAPRIAGLPGYSDAEALRVLTQGAVGRTGTVLRLPMPRFRMTEADARDVIAFLRSIR